MDWSSYLFFKENYHSVKNNIEKCKKEFEKWTSGKNNTSGQFCKITPETITGYLLACEFPIHSNNLSLTDKFHVSVREHYVVSILLLLFYFSRMLIFIFEYPFNIVVVVKLGSYYKSNFKTVCIL